MARLQETGAVAAKRSLGQNFLVSDHVIESILAAVSEMATATSIVEVGPGLGALTEDLIVLAQSRNVALRLIELDRSFADWWRKRASAQSIESVPLNLFVIEADALKLDWSELGLAPGSVFVGNLPYQISSSIVIERSIDDLELQAMVLMFQKEVAQRIVARPRTPEYGLLSVIAQTFWTVKTVCDASPGDFFPAPKVASRVLKFQRRSPNLLVEQAGERLYQRMSAAGFLSFVKSAFAQRRKFLSRNLAGWLAADASVTIETLMHQTGLLPTARAEELDPQTFVRLYLAMIGADRG
jgi:16S rRNA (adenine1518-N6/adenine1519-N6)-dimethyltransferase